MIAVVLLSLLFYALLWNAEGFWGLLLVSLVAVAAMQALPPLGDSLTLSAVYSKGLDYGRIRLWGSVGFIVAAAAAGPLVERLGIDAFLPLLLLMLLLTFGAVAALPPATRDPKEKARHGKGDWRQLLNPRFLTFLICASLLQASHAAYYAFSTLHWQAAGHSETVIGLLWAEGVIAEVLLFALSGRIVGRMRPSTLLLIGGLCGVVRWLVIGETTWLPALVAAQILHAGTFGAAHLGAMHFIARRAPKTLAATAQSLYSALSGGLGMGLALLLAGFLYRENPAFAFFAMAGLTGLAALLAIRLLSFPRAQEDLPSG